MSPHFINTLKQASTPVLTDGHQCAFCYRPSLKKEQLSFISHGEAYCVVCTRAQ